MTHGEAPQPTFILVEPPPEAKAPPKKEMLLPPVEVAKTEGAALPYSIRRLGLPAGAPKALRLAVSPVGHDDVGKVLKELGPGYRFTTLLKLNLLSVEVLKKYDVIFLTCADLYAQDFQAAGALRRFVELGGTLYASDLQCDLLVRAFPEFAARRVLHPAVPQGIDAKVVDPGLEAHLGHKVIPLSFDAPDWRPAAFEPSKVTVCLQGDYRDNQGEMKTAPLLVKFRVKEGTVIFTSFHHSRNDSAIVHKLLEYLVFSSVSARSDTRIRDLMDRHDSSAQSLRPAALHADQTAQGTCIHPGGGLQVALGFEHAGARLKLTLRSADGRSIDYTDEGLFLIDLPDAAPGVWTWTVTPIELPHGTFPVVVAIGRSKGAAKSP
jgi:hypothetical protein